MLLLPVEALGCAPASSGGPAGLVGGVTSSGVFLTGCPSRQRAPAWGRPAILGGATSGRLPCRTDLEALLCDLGPHPWPLWASFHAGKRGRGSVHSKSSEPQLFFLSRSLGVSEMSPQQEPVTQAWWSRGGGRRGGGLGMRKRCRGKVCSLGAGVSAGTPTSSSFLSLQQGQTHRLKGGCCPPV